MSAFQFREAKLPAEAVMTLLTKTGVVAKDPGVDISYKILPVLTGRRYKIETSDKNLSIEKNVIEP